MKEIEHGHKKHEQELKQLTLFDEQALITEPAIPSACPESAIEEWKSLYAAIAQYAKQHNTTENN